MWLISVHNHLDPGDDLPDFVVPLARAVMEGTTERGIALVGSDVAEAPCANKITGVRAGRQVAHYGAGQGSNTIT